MPCYRPLDVWPACPPATGLVFSPQRSYAGAVPFQVPCGGCIGCRLRRAQDWATRMQHEASLHRDNAFLTLSYSDHYLPVDGSVSVRETQLFFKRLRKRVGRLRFFVCGEYGDQLGRPHYHAIIFGFGFPDGVLWRRNKYGDPIFRSPLLEEVWPFGHSEIGQVTHHSAGYVARYCLKKVTGDAALEAYQKPHPVTGEVWLVQPPFANMSRRPGIGANWYDQYSQDAFPSDFLVVDGNRVPVPRYYRKKLEGLPSLALLHKRKEAAREGALNSTRERLAVREEVTALRIRALSRTMESSDG